MKETAKYSGFILMDVNHYKNIYSCIRGYPLEGRQKDYNDEATWMRRGVLLRQLAPLEKDMFAKSVETLMNRSDAHLVIDDELIGSWLKDVESKSLSNRKAGKEGPTADCIACSFTSVLFGVRLRVRGEKLVNNIHSLIDTLPKITTSDENIRLSFDRGYGTMQFIEDTSAKRYRISTIATTIGSRHPFLFAKEMEKYISNRLSYGENKEEVMKKVDLFKGWVGDADEMTGSKIRIAWKQLNDGSYVYAYAMNELFDPTTEDKLLRFFSTGGDNHEEHNYCWVAIPNVGCIDCYTLFGNVGDDEKRKRIEELLLESCHPLTLGQRCADWFLMKILISGTLAGKMCAKIDRVGMDEIEASDEIKREILDVCYASWFKHHHSSSNMTAGTNNEEPTLQKLSSEDFIDCLYDVGLL